MSESKLTSHAMVLVFAGSETTATALSGATYLLLTHPPVLRRVTAEVRSTFSSPGDITLTSVHTLTYMLAVLNEVLRMYPPVTAGMVRKVPRGGQVIAGEFVREGTFVEVQPWSMHHDGNTWEDPWEFRPERFVKGDGGERGMTAEQVEALQPFSVGPRTCLGKKYVSTG
jgi:cytochrome P450